MMQFPSIILVSQPVLMFLLIWCVLLVDSERAVISHAWLQELQTDAGTPSVITGMLLLVASLIGFIYLMQAQSKRKAEEAVRRIRQDQGNHEMEVTCRGEGDLHKSLLFCKKNAGHKGFIPVDRFNKSHLPTPYQDDDIVELTRALSDLTVRVSTQNISDGRPEFYPDSSKPFPFYHSKDMVEQASAMMVGSGWVDRVYRYTDEDKSPCECDECYQFDVTARKTVWGELRIVTAAHVIFDDVESHSATCHFFYDKGSDKIENLPAISKLQMWYRDLVGDWCFMRYVTHDVELLNKLYTMRKRYMDACDKVWSKYNRNNGISLSGVEFNYDKAIPESALRIAVSHPHGCSKQVSVGIITDRQLVEKPGNDFLDLNDGKKVKGEWTVYTYNTPTCPGSSGAPVFAPVGWKWGEWGCGLCHSHKEGEIGNVNSSGIWWEPVSPPGNSCTDFAVTE